MKAANLRTLVKKVNDDYEDDVAFEKKKGHALDEEIKSLEAALKVAHSPDNNLSEIAEFWQG